MGRTLVKLIAKTFVDEAAIKSLHFLSKKPGDFHKFYTLAMPMSEPLLREFVKSYRAVIDYDYTSLVVTSNIDGWHEIAHKMSQAEDPNIRNFVTVLVQGFPEIFNSLKRTLKTDGTLAIRRHG